MVNLNIDNFIDEQLATWPDFAERVQQLNDMKKKEFNFSSFKIITQFNPARAVSSGAKVDKKSISARKCFLCSENRPECQKGIAINKDFTLLVNPFPILKGHLTIASNTHRDQKILSIFQDFLQIAKLIPTHLLFYNGPECGASAPDHAHFQAVTQGQMPFEDDVFTNTSKVIDEKNEYFIKSINDLGRTCIFIHAIDEHNAEVAFKKFYEKLDEKNGAEPKMNVFAQYKNNSFNIFIFPRKIHRPTQYFAEGNDFMMISPGAIDMGGILVLPRAIDFERVNSDTILDVYKQVSLDIL